MAIIGAVSNSRAKGNKRRSAILGTTAAERIAFLEHTHPDIFYHLNVPSLTGYARMAREIRRRDTDILCVNGGDGTLEKVVTALMSEYPTPKEMPLLVPARGGTANLIADAVGVPKRPVRRYLADQLIGRSAAEYVIGETIDRFADIPGTNIEEHGRMLNTARIQTEEHGTQYGFLFGFGVISNYFDLYEDRNYGVPATPGKMKAAYLITQGVLSIIFSRFSQKARKIKDRLLQPQRLQITMHEEGKTDFYDDEFMGAGALPISCSLAGLNVFYGIQDNEMQIIFGNRQATPGGIARYVVEGYLPRSWRSENPEGIHEKTLRAMDIDFGRESAYILGGDVYRTSQMRVDVPTQVPFVRFD